MTDAAYRAHMETVRAELKALKATIPAERLDEWGAVAESNEWWDGEDEFELGALRKFLADGERTKAAESAKRAADSWERSDTDGFLSQWASGLTADKARMQADLIERGSTHEFIALFDLSGNWVPARPVDGRYGRSWYIPGAPKGARYAPYRPARRETLAKRGYVEGFVRRPAKVEIVGSGTGLSGAANCYAAIVEADRPYDQPLAVVTADRWAD